jgi:hypothetical protein
MWGMGLVIKSLIERTSPRAWSLLIELRWINRADRLNELGFRFFEALEGFFVGGGLARLRGRSPAQQRREERVGHRQMSEDLLGGFPRGQGLPSLSLCGHGPRRLQHQLRNLLDTLDLHLAQVHAHTIRDGRASVNLTPEESCA